MSTSDCRAAGSRQLRQFWSRARRSAFGQQRGHRAAEHAANERRIGRSQWRASPSSPRRRRLRREVLGERRAVRGQAPEGRGADRGGGRRHQPPRRLARLGRDRLRRVRLGVPPLRGAAGSPPFWRRRSCRPTLLRPAARRHGAGAVLPAVSDVPRACATASAAGLALRRRRASPSSATCSRRAPTSAIAPSTPTARLLRRRRPHRAAARGDAPLHRLDHAGRGHAVHRLRAVRQVSAAALDAPRLCHRATSSPTST